MGNGHQFIKLPNRKKPRRTSATPWDALLVVPENLEVSLFRSNWTGELPAAAGKNVDSPGMSKAFPSTETKLQCESGTADSTLVPDTKCESGTVDTTVVPDTESSIIPPSSSSTNSWYFTTRESPPFWCWPLGKVNAPNLAPDLVAAAEL